MNCKQCGSEIPDNAAFCTRCGCKAENNAKWPTVIGIIAVIGFALYLIGRIIQFIYYAQEFGDTYSFFNGTPIYYVILGALVPVSFFLHTKKLAFLTAIPMFISLVLYTFEVMPQILKGMHGVYTTFDIIDLALSAVLFLFYVLQMILRLEEKSLCILFMIFQIMYCIFFTVACFYSGIEYMPGILAVKNVLLVLSYGFTGAAYIIAMFSSRKK